MSSHSLKQLVESGEVPFHTNGRCNTVLGFDVSTTVLAAANEFLKSKPIPSLCNRNGSLSPFCSSMRPAWGAKMQEGGQAQARGQLITLMFSHVPEPYELGPPFWSSFDNYVKVLGGSNGPGGAKGWEVVPPPETQNDIFSSESDAKKANCFFGYFL
ncbi:hypothetical protein BT96DRAFT_940005 [Gymnopus androsaceus JB14]|uniref:Uncharacterized protein n=1 Tax=Gymnopus androsaceus JB14 TaxID=1447944 RepID=A0A6A4HLY7_9AGAR|nr:hypothetical protein BT96DRAFT_940005 [Gymnopus androsaceus JB14]